MRVAIIGAGIVGSTCAYYLSKEKINITVFDHGEGQATKASAGIICPWFSKRRNKAWYKMARLGADFYSKLVEDLENDGYASDFYKKTGVFLLKNDESKLEDLYDIAKARREESTLIGDLKFLSAHEARERMADFSGAGRLIFAEGAARVDGQKLVDNLLAAAKVKRISKKVDIKKLGHAYEIDGQIFDKVILATGAWLGQILEPLGYEVDVRPQKGQLRDYIIADKNTGDYPVIMPEGEFDIIPFSDGRVSVGASHENEMAYDLSVDNDLLDSYRRESEQYLLSLKNAKIAKARVGIRAYTSDYSPFYGQLETLENVYVASGLGSSGLTTGTIIGYDLAMLLSGNETILNPSDYPVDRYVKKKDSL
ncbi:FAD-binding oxidoreductase [Gemella sp. 19428wG2_WT2a]|nr:FAD-binding oxidoreductase [Gemella sp. 19428wG2_WT2a]TFU57534.1 FAD-binding oxidoreductase [Gemella sp. WT2a]